MSSARTASYAGSYARVGAPRPTTFDASSPVPARYLARLLAAEINHGMPAQRRMGRVLASAGRHRLPTRLMGQLVRGRPRRPRPDLDDLVRTVSEAWAGLREGSRRLPVTPPVLRCALVERTAVDMVFVFGEGEWPLLVLKRATGDRGFGGLEREARALSTLAGSGVAPLHLGDVGGYLVQEALPGLPLRLTAVHEGNAARLPRPESFDDLDAALEHVATSTARPGPPPQDRLELLRRAADHPLPAATTRAIGSAVSALERLEVTVLQHNDVSAQNWIVHGHRLSGLIDWELCAPDGVPGLDSIEGAVSVFEHGIALARWSDDLVAELFGAAWTSSPYFAATRRATIRSVEAAGLPAEAAEHLTVAYFASRLGRRLSDPGSGSLGSRALASMTETVARDFA